MSLAPLHGIRACVFDAYGTLFDVAAAARTCSAELGEKSSALSTLWREKQLQYTWLRALQGRHADFWQVTGEALDFALETLRLSRSEEHTSELQSRGHLVCRLLLEKKKKKIKQQHI